MKRILRSFLEATLVFLIARSLLVAEAPGEVDHRDAPARRTAADGWEKYLDILAVRYIAPQYPGGEQAFRLEFNISIDVPKGAKITFLLESGATVMDTRDYVLKSENRKKLQMTWKPRLRLPTGDYFFRVRMPLASQTPSVRRILRSKPESFPPGGDPWPFYYADEKDALHVGSPEDEEFERKEICRIYTDFADRLLASMNEFLGKMKLIESGEEMVSAGKLNRKAFQTYVLRWRKQQGEIQEDIHLLREEEPGIFQKTMTAHLNLLELARMVSKRSWQVQREVEKQYGLKRPVNPPSHSFFDRNYRYVVSARTLNERLEKILRLACGQEPEEDPSEGAESATAGEGAAGAAEVGEGDVRPAGEASEVSSPDGGKSSDSRSPRRPRAGAKAMGSRA